MKFLINGAGAVGQYVGSLLAGAAHEVVLISRSQADRLNQQGVRVQHANGQRVRGKVTAVSSLRQALLLAADAPYDYIFLAMKAYDVHDALNEMVAYMPQSDVPMVTLQNGVGVEEMLTEHYPASLIVPASLTVPVQIDASFQVVEEHGGRGLALSRMEGKAPAPLAKALQAAGIPTVLVKNWQAMKWSKLYMNSIGNATAAILNRPPAKLYKSAALYRLETRMLQEIQAVMAAQKLPLLNLPGAPARRLAGGLRWVPGALMQRILVSQVANGRGDKAPSFHADLTAGKPNNEVQFHNGIVQLVGQELGVPTPINGALNHLLLTLVNKEVDWAIYDGKPKEFLAAVQAYISNSRAA